METEPTTPDDISAFGTIILNKQYWIDYFNKNVPFTTKLLGTEPENPLNPISQIKEIKHTGLHRIFYMIEKHNTIIKNLDGVLEEVKFSYELTSKQIRVDVL